MKEGHNIQQIIVRKIISLEIFQINKGASYSLSVICPGEIEKEKALVK